jgi:hypothetical protein
VLLSCLLRPTPQIMNLAARKVRVDLGYEAWELMLRFKYPPTASNYNAMLQTLIAGRRDRSALLALNVRALVPLVLMVGGREEVWGCEKTTLPAGPC